MLENLVKKALVGARTLDNLGRTIGDHITAAAATASEAVSSATDAVTGTVTKDEIITQGTNGIVLVTVAHLSETPLTKARIDLSYAEGGPALAPFQRVYSVGSTPVDAIRALGNRIGWGELADFVDQHEGIGGRIGSGEETCEWFYSFTADGTSMKASGRAVPGGFILDWWK